MVSTNQSASRSRITLALVLTVLPALVIAITFIAWNAELDENLAFHWNASGRVDGFIATSPTYLLAQVMAATAALVGVVVLLIPRVARSAMRDVLLWTGTVSGLSMAFWLVPAGLTYAAGNARQADLGSWLILLAAFIFYGCLTRTAIPPRAELDHSADAVSATGAHGSVRSKS